KGWVEIEGSQTPQPFDQGDVILIPSSTVHILADRPDRLPASILDILKVSSPPVRGLAGVTYGGQGQLTRLVCGFLVFEELLFTPFWGTLPPLMLINAQAEPVSSLLEMGVQQIIHETLNASPGSQCLLARLTELLFVQILRHAIQQNSEQDFGWLSAIQDPIVGPVLGLLHAQPEHDWSVQELANRVCVARSTLASRFSKLLGQPLKQYLMRWRLQLAVNLLRSTHDSMAQIAAQIGYNSEAAFSRAFKRQVGVPPATWRSHNR
ncbi:MAG: AraC family transcriptional regulator, partial [Cyanobacteria bacterium P01_G01_bin.38]